MLGNVYSVGYFDSRLSGYGDNEADVRYPSASCEFGAASQTAHHVASECRLSLHSCSGDLVTVNTVAHNWLPNLKKKKNVFNSRCMLVWPYHRQVPQYRYCSAYNYIADRRPTSATPALPGPPVTFLQTRMTLTNGDNRHPEGSLIMDSHAEL